MLLVPQPTVKKKLTMGAMNVSCRGLARIMFDAILTRKSMPPAACMAEAAVMTAMNTVLGEIMDVPVSISLIQRYGDRVTSPRVRGLVTVLAAQDHSVVEDVLERLDAIGSGPDRYAAAMARMWAAHHRENSGDPEGALAEGELMRDVFEDAPEGFHGIAGPDLATLRYVHRRCGWLRSLWAKHSVSRAGRQGRHPGRADGIHRYASHQSLRRCFSSLSQRHSG